jgi:hypothetical protein
LSGANLRGADLLYANLSDANLSDANLSDANLFYANLSGAVLPCFSVCPETGPFDAYKKVGNNTILKLRIPARAKRTSSLVGRKCRASEVKVLSVVSGDPAEMWSRHAGNDFTYEVGKTVVPTNGFDDDIRIECAPGIHFFMTLREAQEY